MQRDERSLGTVKSVGRAGEILRLFLDGQRGVAVTEVAESLDVSNSTAHRLLRSLCETGLLEQNASTRRYELSLLMHELGRVATLHSDLHGAAHAAIERLHRATGEGCHLAVADLPSVHIVDHLDSDLTRRFIRRMRWRAPANCTSTGKVLLALAPAAAREDVLRGRLARLTTRSLTDAQRLRAELEDIGERGYASSRDETQLGVTSVAAPVVGADGRVVAAIGLAGPSTRMRRLSLDRALDQVRACAAEVSAAVR
jgi:IclR family acetate operon transcriptional repressor